MTVGYYEEKCELLPLQLCQTFKPKPHLLLLLKRVLSKVLLCFVPLVNFSQKTSNRKNDLGQRKHLGHYL